MKGITPILNASTIEIFKIIISPTTPVIYIVNVPKVIPRTGLWDSLPIIWAARKKPIIYPIVGLFNIANPATLPEKNGNPANPVKRYINILKDPKVLPSINPASITTNV